MLQAWSDEDEAGGYLRMVGRLRAGSVRGEAYARHGRELAIEVLRPLADRMRSEFGFTIDEFLAVATAVESLVSDRVNQHMVVIADFFEDMRRYSVDELSDERRLELGNKWMSLWSEFPRKLIFASHELAAHADIEEATVDAVLRRLSLAPGELEASAYRSPLDPCPFWQRPFLRSGDRFVLPVPGHALRSTLDVFEPHLLTSYKRFSRHRADVVDALALEYLARVLPGCETFGPSAYYWFDDGDGRKRFETDGLIVFEEYVLIVEGKANALSPQAHRGDLTRLGRDVGNTLQSAWEQCARVHRFLLSAPEVEFEEEHGIQTFEIADTALKRFLYVNPMLHTLGVFALELPRLRSLLRFESSGSPWPVLITDLRVVTECIGGPAELLHYLEWRSALPIGDQVSVSDELDVFATYLFGGLGAVQPEPEQHVVFASSTTTFDDYYIALERGQSPEPPRRVLGDWLESVLDALATQRPRRWLEQSFAVLDLTLEEAAELTAWFQVGARSDIHGERWIARQSGDVVSVALAPGVQWTEVLLELSPIISRGRRWFVARIEPDHSDFMTCGRNGQSRAR